MDSSTVTTVDRGPRRVARQAVVAAPAEALFSLLANPHRHHEVDGGGTVKPSVIGPRDLQHGDRFTVAMKMGPVPYRITSTVSDLQPGRVVEWRHPGKHTWRWEFEPQGDDSTLVTEVFDYSSSPLAPVLERAKVPARNARGIEASLRRLQDRARTGL